MLKTLFRYFWQDIQFDQALYTDSIEEDAMD
jgi:hypothetical protein